MRRIAFSLALCLVVACGEDDEDRNPPPVGSGNGGPMVGSASGSNTNGSATSGAGASTGAGGSSGIQTGGLTMGPLTTASSSGAVLDTILTGRFLDGGGGFALPITCTVRFHRPGEINPSNGVDTASTFSRAFEIDAFPQSFTITNDEIGGVVMLGDPGYITSECDIDGDNFFDDQVGAFFPGLPMTEIAIPASSIDLTVGPV